MASLKSIKAPSCGRGSSGMPTNGEGFNAFAASNKVALESEGKLDSWAVPTPGATINAIRGDMTARSQPEEEDRGMRCSPSRERYA